VSAEPPQPETTTRPPDPTAAGKCPSAWVLLLIATAIALGLDLGSKHLAFQRVADAPVSIDRAKVLEATSLDALIPVHDPVVAVPNGLEFTLVLNPGAVFGIGAGRRWFFVAFTVGALVFALLIFARWTTAKDRGAHIALAMLIAGGVGNLYDRMLYACVRDFIHPLPGVTLPFGIRWPSGSREVWPYVSNVADLFLLLGIGALLIYSWRKPVDDERDSDSSAAKEADPAATLPPPA